MTAVTDNLRYHLAYKGVTNISALVSSAANAQAGATPLPGELHTCLKATATGSFILPSILSGEAKRPVYVCNDTAVTINVFPFVGEKINGAANTALSLTTGQAAIFIPVPNSYGSNALDWRAAAIS